MKSLILTTRLLKLDIKINAIITIVAIGFWSLSATDIYAHPKWMTGCTLMLPVERNKCQKMPVTHKHPGEDTGCYTLETPIYGKSGGVVGWKQEWICPKTEDNTPPGFRKK